MLRLTACASIPRPAATLLILGVSELLTPAATTIGPPSSPLGLYVAYNVAATVASVAAAGWGIAAAP
jgi:hypothetical protein